MMNKKIQVLDNNLINKIAAGEVVERPLSVVKELLENSIDAGATSISIETDDGGISRIRISDNGCGIPKDQLKTAFLRHATSKINSVDDLLGVLSLGFRGEALSSIASVSQLELISKTADEVTGSKIIIEGGKVISESEAGNPDGTTITVRNLFYNIPARRKFLKKPATESAYISETIEKLALGHPEIAFKYICGSKSVLQTNGNNDLKTVIFQIYGKDTAKKLIPINFQNETVKIHGYICRPEISRGNRAYGNFYINGRYIKSELMQGAVENAYKTRLMQGKFPVFVLNIEVKPDIVDVNVHPTKLEVRFSNEDMIYDCVYDAVTEALQNENLIPEVALESSKKSSNVFVDETNPLLKVQNNEDKQKTFYPHVKIKPPEYDDIFYNTDGTDIPSQLAEAVLKNDLSELEPFKVPKSKTPTQPIEKQRFFVNYKIIGLIFNTYWIVEQDGSMYLIDQHAAHERALYEDLLDGFKSGEIYSQNLVVPEIIRLKEIEIEIIKDNFDLLKQFGFVLDELNPNEYAIKSLPVIFKNVSNAGFFIEILDMLSTNNSKISNLYDAKLNTIATIACKAAVKANDKLSYIEAEALIKRILNLENPFTCPHGRPTIVAITKYELEKKFMRVT